MSEIITFNAGEVILLQGERSDDLFILLEGTIEVIKNNTVISTISEPETFFGEMSYLLSHKRTASLRAKTDVKAMNVNYFDKQSDRSDIVADASLKLMRAMASRLDLANKEIHRLEHYQTFRNMCFSEASSTNDVSMLEKLEIIDKKVNIQERNRSYQLIKDYLTTSSVWHKLKESVIDIISYYTDIELEVTRVYTFDKKVSPTVNTACYIEFFGDREGKLILNMSKGIIEKVAFAFGIKDMTEEITLDTVSEMSNQILGQLKKKVSSNEIRLGTPHKISDEREIDKILGEFPALEIQLSSAIGNINLIYQVELSKYDN